MATSYFRRRARNPYLDSIDPSPIGGSLGPQVRATFAQPTSPAVAAPQPLEVIEAPATSANPRDVMGEILRAAAVDPIETARDVYASKLPTTTKGRILEALKTAGLGFLQSAARDPNNPIAAGLGGAAAGGAISAISPKAGRAYQFETIQRPGIEDQLRRQEAQRQRQRQIEGDALKTEETRADIELKRANAVKARTPPRAVSPIRGRPGDVFLDPETRQPIAQIPLAPEKQPAAVWRETYTGRTFNIADPAQRAEYERIQSHGPRDKAGRFITAAGERAAARASAPKVGGGDKDAKAMTKAVEVFNQTKRALEDATARGDNQMVNTLRSRLQSMGASLASKYGDRLEVGGGQWPYQKPRGGQSAPASKASTSRSSAKSKLMANGYNSTEADAELDRLGIR